jgi:phage gp46-like protein
MELKLKNRDYCPDGSGGLERGDGAQAVLGRVLFRLTARRGALPFLPELGSRLHEVLREKPSARLAAARQYVAQALEQEDVEITNVTLEETQEGAQLVVSLLWQGEALSVTTQLKGG